MVLNSGIRSWLLRSRLVDHRETRAEFIHQQQALGSAEEEAASIYRSGSWCSFFSSPPPAQTIWFLSLGDPPLFVRCLCRPKSNSSCCWLFPWTPSGVPNGHRHFRIPQWCHPITRYVSQLRSGMQHIFHWCLVGRGCDDHNAMGDGKCTTCACCRKYSCSFDLSRKG